VLAVQAPLNTGLPLGRAWQALRIVATAPRAAASAHLRTASYRHMDNVEPYAQTVKEHMEQEKSALTQLDAAVKAKSGIANLTAAYVKARKNVSHAPKDRNNPHFKNDYATLESVLDSFTPAFLEQDLALIQAPGEIVGDNASLTGMLLHGPSGETIAFRMSIPLGGKATAQSYGSAITYARRYQAAGIAGITQSDDDGEAASNPPSQPGKKATKGKTDPSYAANVEALLAEIEGMNRDNFNDLRKKVADLGDSKVIDAFQAKKNELASKKAA
jgi:hypothetical protein